MRKFNLTDNVIIEDNKGTKKMEERYFDIVIKKYEKGETRCGKEKNVVSYRIMIKNLTPNSSNSFETERDKFASSQEKLYR